MTCNQRSTAHSLQSRGGFLSSFLSQSKKGPSRPTHSSGASPMQTGSVLLGKKEPTNHQVILNWKLLSLQGVNAAWPLLQAFASTWRIKCPFLPCKCMLGLNAAQEQLLFFKSLWSLCRCLVALLLLLLFVLQPTRSITLLSHFSAFQSTKGKEGTMSCKDGKSHYSGLMAGESSSLQQRQKRLQEHGKERKELLSKGTFQVLHCKAGKQKACISVKLRGKTSASVSFKLWNC